MAGEYIILFISESLQLRTEPGTLQVLDKYLLDKSMPDRLTPGL